MKQCPECKREMKDQLSFCPFDGQPLLSVEATDKLIGLILDDKYRIEEKIGIGGMGKVYKATHIHMDHTVAIKILHSHLASDTMALERFRREARAAALLRHPNAVAVTDFGVTKEGGIAYLVMELLEGEELRERIKQERYLDFEECFIITQQICQALHAAHSKGIIHRDLKPDNIWLLKSENGLDHVKVLDFGIAKLKTSNVENLTQQGMIVGTPYYMSPEQCLGDELDARSDIYSLGIIIYEMLTGQVPFQASTPMGVALKQTHEPPKPPHQLRPGLPEPIENVVLRALRKKREDRPSTAIELAQEFETALFHAGIELKLLGTRTPQTGFTLNTPTDQSYRTPPPPPQAGVPDISMGQVGAAGAASAATPWSGGPQQAGITTPGQVDMSRQSGSQSQAGRVPAIISEPPKSRRGLFIAFVALLIVGAIVSIYFLTRPKQAQLNKTASGGEADSKTGTKSEPRAIPPAPAGMVLVTGGTFLMGNPKGDEFEQPVRQVPVNSFYMDQYEVTNRDYYKFVVEKKYSRWPEGWPDEWKAGKFKPGEGERPVTVISWTDAQAYAQWAEKRLPTEVEWEYAARGSDGRLYPWGKEFKPNLANINGQKATAVNAFSSDKSPFNVIGMAGNVSEWTSSVDTNTGKVIVRGANYENPSEFANFKGTVAEFARVTRKLRVPPDAMLPTIGFRCVRDVPQQ